MYETSKKWKQNIYENPVCAMNIYIDDVLINPDYILDFKKGGNVFEEEFCLGGTPSQYIEMKLYKDKIPLMPSKIKVEYGILISHSLTVTEVNAMLVGTLNGIPVKSLSSNNSSFEIIPIGIYNIDDYTDNDDNTITIKALDNMIKFEFNYNGKELIDKKNEATLLEVAQDICNKAGVELGSTSFLNSDKKVSVYDNTVTAREYISYIAESAGCFACIDRKGKLCFREFCQDEIEIPLEMFGEYKWGEEFKISKLSYEDGLRSFKFGEDTRNNLWINQENMYIVDEEQIQKIYNKIKGLTVNTFKGKTVIDPAIDIGDKIVIDGRNIIYQGEMSLEGRFIAQISSKIQIKQKEETTVKKESQKVVNRRVQSRIDQAEGKIEQVAEETSENTKNIAKQEISINGITQEVSKKVDESKLGTAIEQNYEHVKVAWNQISDFIQMMIINKNASLAILDKDKNVMMALDKTGQHFYKEDGTEFGEMGVNTIDNQNYISFGVTGNYGEEISNGMAWGITTKKDNKFWPILYIKNFAMSEENSDGSYGELILSNCNLVLEGMGTGIKTGGVSIYGEPSGFGLYFLDEKTNKTLITILPRNVVDYESITILDNITFYANEAGSNSFRLGSGDNYCLFTDNGDISGSNCYIRGDITNTGYLTAYKGISCTDGYVSGKAFINNSREETKKNIKRYTDNAIKIIKDTDIYKFNYKTDNSASKESVGFIIGDKYKYSKELTAVDENGKEVGANTYNMISIAYKAIQEQQEQIEELQAKDKQKDELIQSLIKRIETLEKEVNK